MGIDDQSRQISLAGNTDVQIRLTQGCFSNAKVRVLFLSHRLYLGKLRQIPWRIKVVNDGEILIQARKQKNSKIYTGILHYEHRFLERGPLLLVLKLGFHHVSVRNLAGVLLPLSHIKETLSG